MKLTNLFALSLLLIVGLVFSVYAGKSDCTNLDGDGAKPIIEVSSEDVAVQNDYDMVVEEDDRDGADISQKHSEVSIYQWSFNTRL